MCLCEQITEFSEIYKRYIQYEANETISGGNMMKKWRLLVTKVCLVCLGLVTISPAIIQSRQTHGYPWYGDAQLTGFERRVTIHPFFMDIEEDYEMKPTGRYQPYYREPGDSTTLEMYGEFSLPEGVAVTGVLIWDGEKILQGTLKGKSEARSQYESIVSRKLDPVLIEQTGSDSIAHTSKFNISIFPATYNQTRKIRIRYLVPQTLSLQGKYFSIPPSLAGGFCKFGIKNYKLSLIGTNDISKVFLSNTDTTSTFLCNLPFIDDKQKMAQFINKYDSTIGIFSNSINIKVKDHELPQLITTQFDTGNYKGNYSLFWGTPPDSLLVKAGLRREVAFLWKWNFPQAFVELNGLNKKVSMFGRQLLAQAKQIDNAVKNIYLSGDKSALVVDKGNRAANKLFRMCSGGSATADSISAYLFGIDSNFLFATCEGAKSPVRIRVDESEREKFYKNSIEDFDISLKTVVSLYSPDKRIIKHLVVITAGPLPDMSNNYNYYSDLDSILGKDITLSGYGSSPLYPLGYWPGVPMHQVVEKHALDTNGAFTSGYWMPEQRVASFSATLSNSKTSVQMPLGFYRPYVGRLDSFPKTTLTFACHSTVAWNPTIEWKAYSLKGDLLGICIDKPDAFYQPQDTFVGKLWAASPIAISDTTFLSDRGFRFGIVDTQYSLLALPDDAVSAAQNENLATGGLPFLRDDQIFPAPHVAIQNNFTIAKQLHHGIIVKQIANGTMKIFLPGIANAKYLRIFDARGRLLVQFTSEQLAGKEFVILQPAVKLASGLYLVELVCEKEIFRKQYTITR